MRPLSNKLINLLLNLNPLLLQKRYVTAAFLAATWVAAGWFIFWPIVNGMAKLWALRPRGYLKRNLRLVG